MSSIELRRKIGANIKIIVTCIDVQTDELGRFKGFASVTVVDLFGNPVTLTELQRLEYEQQGLHAYHKMLEDEERQEKAERDNA